MTVKKDDGGPMLNSYKAARIRTPHKNHQMLLD